MRLTKLSTGRNHRFSRIGQPKNAKSPIAGASLRDCWQEHCYTVASVLQCPRHQKQNSSEAGISGAVLGTANGVNAGSDVRSLEPDCSNLRINSHANLYVWRALGANLHDLHHPRCAHPAGLCVALVQHSETSTYCTPKGASCDGVELGANPGTRLHCSDAPLPWPMKRCPGSVRKDLARASPNPVNRNFFCGAG